MYLAHCDMLVKFAESGDKLKNKRQAKADAKKHLASELLRKKLEQMQEELANMT